MKEKWKFESKFNKETNKYEKNFEVAFATPVRECTTNGGVYCATADASTAVQLAANDGSGYNGTVLTVCYSQKFIVHCWQFADPWDRQQYLPAAVNVSVEVYKPEVRIPYETISFTPKIDIEKILLSLNPFVGIVNPYKLDKLDIYMYLFTGKDPIITCHYGFRSAADDGYILESSVSEEWHDNRENDVNSMKRTVVAQYSSENYHDENDEHLLALIKNTEYRTREYDKIRCKYPELFSWYCNFIKNVEKRLMAKHPDQFEHNEVCESKNPVEKHIEEIAKR